MIVAYIIPRVKVLLTFFARAGNSYCRENKNREEENF